MLACAQLCGAETVNLVVGSTHCSEWLRLTQDQINAFAAATGDRQWIHRDDVEPAKSPFGEPIAHGLLLVSLTISMARDCGALPEATWIIYGIDKLRFRAPVKSSNRIRCRATILGVRELYSRRLVDVRFVAEIEGQKIPALVTDCSLVTLNPVPEYSTAPAAR